MNLCLIYNKYKDHNQDQDYTDIMGNQQLVCGKFIGPKKQGETRILRNAFQVDKDESLISDYKGMTNLKEIYQ